MSPMFLGACTVNPVKPCMLHPLLIYFNVSHLELRYCIQLQPELLCVFLCVDILMHPPAPVVSSANQTSLDKQKVTGQNIKIMNVIFHCYNDGTLIQSISSNCYSVFKQWHFI